MGPRTRISLFILLLLGLHALPVLSYQGARQTRWPILAWAMYARSYPPGPIEVVIRRLVAVSPDGTRRQVTYKDVGLPSPAFHNNYLAPFSRGDSAAARWLVDQLDRTGRKPVVELRLETVRYRLTDPGVAVDTLPVISFRTIAEAAR